MANEQEVLDSKTQEQEVIPSTSEKKEETPEPSLEDLKPGEWDSAEDLTEKNRHLYARLKKEEEKRKKAETQLKETASSQTQPQVLSEELAQQVSLVAGGLSVDDLRVLEDIRSIEKAKGKAITYLEASENFMFKAYKNEKAKEEKAQKAQLGASKGSSGVEQKKPMTREEHMAYVRETTKKLDRGELKI